jgi:tetratricopeptide (TPR) repeat protein
MLLGLSLGTTGALAQPAAKANEGGEKPPPGVQAPGATAPKPAPKQPKVRAPDRGTTPLSDNEKRALGLFQRAERAFEQGRFVDAIGHLREADRIAPNPSLVHDISLAYEQLGDKASALRYARDYLRRNPEAKDRKRTEQRIALFERALEKKGVQQLTVRSEPAGATVQLDGRAVGITPWTGELRPGSHRIAVQRRGYRDQERPIVLSARAAQEQSFELERTPEPDERSAAAEPVSAEAGVSAASLLALGGGVLALGGGMGLEIAGLDTNDKGLLAGGHLLLGVGAAATAAGLVMLYLDLDAPAAVSVACAPNRCGAIVSGRF